MLYRGLYTLNKAIYSTKSTYRLYIIFNIKEELIQTHGENLKSLKMNAKDYDEEAINYNLLDYKFASFVYISMLSLKTEEDFYNIITDEYKKIQKILEEFIQ